MPMLNFSRKKLEKEQERTKETLSITWRYTVVPVVSISDYFCWESSPHQKKHIALPMRQLDKATALLECR